MIKKYFKIWWIFAFNSMQSQLTSRWIIVLFLISKIIRFAMFIVFILVLLKKTQLLAGYNLNQTLFFFLSFNFLDTLVQTIFREVYNFRPAIVNGTFDFYLIRPFNPLFRALFGGPDLIDLLLLIPLLFAVIHFMQLLGVTSIFNIFIYIMLMGAAFVIALSFHILVLSLAVLTTEIDHAILVYRDITGMGRFPIDIYKEPLKGFITFIIPVGIMMSFPVKGLIGFLSPPLILYALSFAIIFLIISIKVWNWSLKQYSSASS